MAETQQEATGNNRKRAFKPFLFQVNKLAKDELLFNVRRFFNMAQEIKSKLDEKGVEVTAEVLIDCLTMRKRPQGEGESFTYVYENCKHIDEELARQLDEGTEGLKSRIVRENLTSAILQAKEALKDEILKIRSKYDEARYNRIAYMKYVLFEDGEMSLIPDLEHEAEQATGFAIKTDAQNEAYEAHKRAARAITEFLNHFPKSVWPSNMTEVGNLFKFSEESGEFEPQVIDYSSYIS